MRYLLQIKLLSAAHVGSGEGWASLVDAEIVKDDLGIPYIPARRIKGILRENALDLVSAFSISTFPGDNFSSDQIIKLFGDRGQMHSAPLIIENAILKGYSQLRPWIEWAQYHCPGLAGADQVLDSFCHLRKQTALDNGVAQEHSLRITRVLNQDHEFISEIELKDAQYLSLLALTVQVTRSLGTKRNRGLGKIQCKLLDYDTRADLTAATLEQYRLTHQAERSANVN